MMLSRTCFKASLVTLGLITIAIADADKPCTVHDDGKFYDLNTLKASKDYEVKWPGGRPFPINVCQAVKTETFGLKDEIAQADVGAFVRRAHGDFALGKVNTTLSVFDSKPRITISQGSHCTTKDGKSTDVRASAVIDFICEMSVFGSGEPLLVAQLPPGSDDIACAYMIEWRTHLACPTSESGGFWGFIAITAVIFLVLLMTYTVLGTLYNRYVLQLRGFDQIPQFSVESMKYHGSEAWNWISDIISGLDIGGGGLNRPGPTSASTPSGLPFSANSIVTPNPVSHHAQTQGTNIDPEDIIGPAPLGRGLGGAAGAGGFVRPQLQTRGSSFSRKPETNPVSHQTQVNAAIAAQSLSFTASKSPPPKSPPHPRQQQPLPSSAPSSSTTPRAAVRPGLGPTTGEERQFMLGDDQGGDDGQEMDFVKPAPSEDDTAAGSSNGSNSSMAVLRGRDLGGGEMTRL
ncbi:hypothetical protein K443DRAFT_681833 [Laccaria amethystina LaAM-08-1]|uniref:Autophagy-related protein 27 n=1 Tax=Laccaria amethystina LaAM-08-1 TaxID=1095629 RepID=A0A0C9XLQ1_9AGAR|nr:hypothetical protein K443DRAFT_681833 [Laccaria amethystina LaAM-08-1]